jgi:tetratricopeptide (TPR) repeat protein
MVEALSDGSIPDEAVEQILKRSDGVPLYVEELTKNLVEAGDTTAASVPESLQDSLTARLDRLSAAREVAQVASLLGSEFRYRLLAAVAPIEEAALRDGLRRLVDADLMFQRGAPPDATFTFKHTLIQDTAAASLLKRRRRELHEGIALVLEEQFPAEVERSPEELARHFDAAQRPEQAIVHYQRAGERAAERSANEEAIGHLTRAIELLRTLPETRERNRQELGLQLALGSALMPARGYGALEAERAYGRARELCGEIGEPPELFRAFIGLSMFYFHRGQTRISTDLAERALALAERAGEAPLLLAAHTRLGINLIYMGEQTRALDHFEQAIRVHDPAEHRSLVYAWGQDWGVIARGFAASALRALGYPDRARRMSLQAIEMARAGDPNVLALALSEAAADHCLLGELERALAFADEAITVARKRGLPFVAMMAGILRARALGGARGVEELEELVARLEALGAGQMKANALFFLVAAEFEFGRMEEARAALERAFACAGGVLDSELHLLKGEILLRQDARAHAEDAERCFRRALEIARGQKAKSYELRAATSLARLLRDQEQRDDARALLAPVYNWFTEGFDTQDLKDAKALLDELA